MSESPTGWYQDDEDPGLARWWDGERWTEHTMVLPEGVAPKPAGPVAGGPVGTTAFASSAEAPPPLPPVTGSTRFPRPADASLTDFEPVDEPDLGADPEPTAVAAGVGADLTTHSPDPLDTGVLFRPDWLDAPGPAHRRQDDDSGRTPLAHRIAGWPVWARVALPVLAIVALAALALAAAGSLDAGDGENANNGSTSVPSTSSTAVTFLPLGTVAPTPTLDASTTTSIPSTTTTKASTATTARTTTTAAPTTTLGEDTTTTLGEDTTTTQGEDTTTTTLSTEPTLTGGPQG